MKQVMLAIDKLFETTETLDKVISVEFVDSQYKYKTMNGYVGVISVSIVDKLIAFYKIS